MLSLLIGAIYLSFVRFIAVMNVFRPRSRKSELTAVREYLTDIWRWVAPGCYVSIMVCLIIGAGIQDLLAQPLIVKSDREIVLKTQFGDKLPLGLADGVKQSTKTYCYQDDGSAC